MYSHNGYFHPIAAAAPFQPIPQLMFQTDNFPPNDDRLSFLNEQMLLNEAKSSEVYILDKTPLQQITQMCVVMEKQGTVEECLKLLNKLESTCHSQSDPTLKLKCKVLYEQSQFDALYQIIQNHHFHRDYHRDLQSLWNDAHYKETENVRGGKGLDPVSRYRVRRKHAYPRTIWDGEGTSYCFKKRDRKILKEAYERNSMPNQAEKQALAQRTELNVTQVSNWFKNQRQRARQHRKEQRAHKYSHSVNDDYIESDRDDSARSGNSGSRGSNPLSEDDDHTIPLQHGIHPLNLMSNSQQTASTSLPAISPASTNLCPTDQQINLNSSVSTTTNVYNNFNFAPHFESYWPTNATPAATNPFSAAQMCYPFGMYSYPNYTTYPTMYPSASYIKFMNTDSNTQLSVPSNLMTNNQTPQQQQNENYQFDGQQQLSNSKYLPVNTKYEPTDNDYQNL